MSRCFTPIFTFFSLGMLLISCEEPIDLKLDDKERLVVISNFSHDEDLVVLVSKTQSILSTNPADYISDATVMVFSGSQLLEVLELVPADESNNHPPYYMSKEINPVVGEVYTIKVVAPGFDPVTATNSIPAAVPIDSVVFSNTFGDDFNFDAQVSFNVTVTFKDPVDVRNYYHLVFYQELIPFLLLPTGDTIKADGKLNTPIQAQLKDPDFPALRYIDNRSFLIKDNPFNGQTVTASFTGSYTFDRSKYIPGDFFVELRTVSEAYYLYHSTLTRQVNSGHPLSEGVVIYDNIENGEGIFAGYSSVVNSFRLSD